jgi:hypothetical protein
MGAEALVAMKCYRDLIATIMTSRHAENRLEVLRPLPTVDQEKSTSARQIKQLNTTRLALPSSSTFCARIPRGNNITR